MDIKEQYTLTDRSLASPITGRPRLFDTPESLWERFVQYAEWQESHPWKIQRGGKTQGSNGGETTNTGIIAIPRPYTLCGFCSFAGIFSKWADFRRNYSEREGFLEVLCAIENAVLTQQLEGAIAEQYSANLVARVNGIAEVQKTDVTSSDGSFRLPKLSKEDLAEIATLNDKL